MSSTKTKPCARCGTTDEAKLTRATPKRWLCVDCNRAEDRKQYQRHKARIIARRHANRMKIPFLDPYHPPTEFLLMDDPTGLYRPRLTTLKSHELRGLVEDAYAPTGSIWQGDDGGLYRVDGPILQAQTIILIGEA